MQAQTTLSGDHIVTGDLNVGTTGTTGNLLVTGDTGNTAPPGLNVTGDGGVVFTGSLGVGQIPASGAGTRFMWYPKKAAFRAGYDSMGLSWSDSLIGGYSVAFGESSTASGSYSAAFGTMTFAGGEGAVAFGSNTAAGGVCSLAAGFDSLASGNYSITAGTFCVASGWYSIAIGNASEALENHSIAFGEFAYAAAEHSLAIGNLVASLGKYSSSFGYQTTAAAYNSFVVGRNNIGGGESDSWEEEDPLLEVGNGSGDPNDPPEIQNRNALTVYKNGDITIPKRQGDILMGEFGNPE